MIISLHLVLVIWLSCASKLNCNVLRD